MVLLVALGGAPDAALSAAQSPAAPSRPASELLSVELLVPGGGRLAWSAQGDRIAYDKAGPDGLYDLYVQDLESTYERCLTCTMPDFKKAHALNPDWHPSGGYLVFQAQQQAKSLRLGAEELATPQRSVHSDLWLVRTDGVDYWRITRLAEIGSAVLDPHFSYEGDKLVWSERTASRSGAWGSWRLRTGEVGFGRGVPRLSKLAVPWLPSQPGLVVAHGFLADDLGFLVSAQIGGDGSSRGLDIYRLDGKAGGVERLTRSRHGLDEYARIAPRNGLVAFTSDAELATGAQPISELWLMRSDGGDKRALTAFNHADNAPTWVGDFAWSPTGDRILAQVLRGRGERQEAIYLLHLSATLARSTDGSRVP